MEKLKKIETLKDEALQEIWDNPKLSKVEKLKLINKNDLLKTSPFLLDPFKDQEKKYLKFLNMEYPSVDDIFSPGHGTRDKHEMIYFDEECENALQGYHDEEGDLDASEHLMLSPDAIIPILSNRRSNSKMYVTAEQFVDIIYNYVKKSGYIGFELDW